jgi:DNA-binding NtrC family response regulator
MNAAPLVLVVDPDRSVRESIGALLRGEGWQVALFGRAREFLQRVNSLSPSCVVLDFDLPDMDGLQVQKSLSGLAPQVPVIFLSAQADIAACVQALKAGARNFLSKPCESDELLEVLRREICPPATEPRPGGFIGNGAALLETLRRIDLVARTDATVLISGESGTGKELVARAIHDQSPRRSQPLVRVNCGAVPDTLFESEFFGHVKGAFTGALRDKPGRFELAQGGTLFLDEIGEVPLPLQAKLLRVLQEHEVERVGDTRPRRVDVRIIAATNRNLAEEVQAGRFRQDLYYRLNVFPIENPPLRERREDIPQLAEHFLRITAKQFKQPVPRLNESHLRQLAAHNWPGNIRELQNTVEQAVILARQGALQFCLPPASVPLPAAGTDSLQPFILTRAEMKQHERESIATALAQTSGKVAGPDGAAALLGMKATTLHSRILALGICRKTA